MTSGLLAASGSTILVKYITEHSCWQFTSYKRGTERFSLPIPTGSFNFRGSVALAFMSKLAEQGNKVIVEGVDWNVSIGLEEKGGWE